MQIVAGRRESIRGGAHRKKGVAVRFREALIVVGLAAVLGGCSSTAVPPSSAPPAVRAVGSPAPVALQDLNQWIGDTAIIDGDLSFGLGEVQLTTEGQTVLTNLASKILSSDGDIVIDGFADGVGGFSQENVDISEERAEAVAEWLRSTYPDLSNRTFHTNGYGAGGSVAGVRAIDGVPDPLRRVVVLTVR